MELINERYQLIKITSSDSLGVIWHARDVIKQDRSVRLRILPVESSGSLYVQDLIRRFIEMGTVHHTYLLNAFSLDRIRSADNRLYPVVQYFYTSEYFDEQDCISYMDLSESESLEAIRQLCYVLNYLHFRGVVYKYLNFSNVLFFRTDEGLQVRLRELPTVFQYREQISAYTSEIKQFLSPETIHDSELNPASDIYSFGVLLYYLVQRIPYETSRFESFKMEDPDSDFLRLVENMTFINPSERFANIQEVVDVVESLWSMEIPFVDRPLYEQLQTSMPIVGRQRELDRIMEIVHNRMELKSDIRCLLIQGESGIGKSRLIQEIHYLNQMGRQPGVRIDLPFQHTQGHFVFQNILREILKNQIISPELIKKYGSEIIKVVPEMKETWKIVPADSLADDAENMRLNNRIYSFVMEHVQSNPFTVYIDDFENMSTQDFSILEYLINTPRKLPLLFVASVRDESASFFPTVSKWVTRGRCETVYLNKFGFSEAAEMIQKILGIGESPISLTARIMNDAAGNPRAIEEAIKILFMYEYLRIEDDRHWSDPVDSIGDLELTVIAEEPADHELMFDSECRQVLDCISVFDAPAPRDVLNRMLEIDSDTITEILEKLVVGRVLNRKLGDWGYTFDFFNKRLRKRILADIPYADRQNFHQIAADYLEKICTDQGAPYMEALIYHLNNSQQLNKAAQYAYHLARQMEQMNHNRQALDFYTMALRLYQEMGKDDAASELMIRLGDVYLSLNDSEKALQLYDQAIAHAEQMNQFECGVDARIRSISIHIFMKDYETLDVQLSDLIRQCKDVGYLNGQLEAALALCRVYLAFGRFEEMRELVDRYLPETSETDSGSIRGRFLNEKGICYSVSGKTSDAFMTFLESCSMLEKAESWKELIRPYNNLGILNIDYLGDIDRGREYFIKSIGISERLNLIWGMDMLYSNLSETYMKEDNFPKALDCLHRACRLAEESSHFEMLFYIYSNLCAIHVSCCQYDEAYRYLTKLDYEYQNRKGHALNTAVYFLCHIQFALEMRSFDEALEWYHRAYDERINIPDNLEFVFRLQKLKIDHIRDSEHPLANLENHLSTLIKATTNPIEIRMIRDVILDIALENMNRNQLVALRKFLDLDSELIEYFDTERLRNRRAMLSGVFESDQLRYYQNLIENPVFSEQPVELWHAHYFFGREMDSGKDVFQALVHYYHALDILKAIVQKVPERYRDSFLLNDEMKIVLHHNVHQLVGRIIGNSKRSVGTKDTPHPLDARHYFVIQDEERILTNTRFLQNVYRQYGKKFGFQAGSTEEMISLFGPDEHLNIQTVLKYMTQITFADSGFLIFHKDFESMTDCIATDAHAPVPNVSRFASHMELDTDGLLIRYSDSRSYQQNQRKESFIILPVSCPQGKTAMVSRRRNESKSRSGRAFGYVILQSEKPFNNFTAHSFEQCRTLMRTLFVLVENYTLKHSSVIDKLTGTYLRKYMEMRLAEEFERCKSQQLDLSIIMADIDHFKNVNDVYGHQKGDEVLSGIGGLIRKSLRKGDFVGRYGGEEFIIVLPETDEIDAYKVCEKIRRLIESTALLNDDTQLTMSFGVSCSPTHGVVEEELIEKADQALYESKHMGRNRTTIWTSNIGVAKQRFDKLAGILEGNISVDSRRIQAMVDVMGLVSRQIGWEGKIYEILSQLVDITEAQTGFMVRIQDGNIGRWLARTHGIDGFDHQAQLPEELILQAVQNGYGNFFVDWETVQSGGTENDIPDWFSYMIVPLAYMGEVNGVLVLSVRISRKEFDFNAFNFVNTLGNVISVVLMEQEVKV